MNMQLLSYNRGSYIKSYWGPSINVSPFRNKMAFWCKIHCFWVQEFFKHIFLIAFHNFCQESSFLALLMVRKKGNAYFLLLKMGRVNFWLLKKRKGMVQHPPKNVKPEYYSILPRISFPHSEFCKESVFLILNFVKNPFISY